MEDLYFESDHLKLYHDPVKKMGHSVWFGFVSGEDLRQAVRQCLRLQDEENPVFWLADNRKMKAIRQTDQEWIEQEMIPKVVMSSIEKMATLVSEDIFNQMAVESLYTRSADIVTFEHQYFKDEAQALAWLA